MGEDERVKRREEGGRGKLTKAMKSGANCAKGRWGMPSRVGRTEGGRGMGGAVERDRWCRGMVRKEMIVGLHRNLYQIWVKDQIQKRTKVILHT